MSRYGTSFILSLALYLLFGGAFFYASKHLTQQIIKKDEPKIVKIKMIEPKKLEEKPKPKEIVKKVEPIEPIKEIIKPKIVEEKVVKPIEKPIIIPQKVIPIIQKPKEIVVTPKVTPIIEKPKIVTQVHAKMQIVTKTLPQVKVKTQTVNEVVTNKPTKAVQVAYKETTNQNATKETKKVEIVKVESTPKYSEKEIDDWKIDFKNRARHKIELNKQYPSIARNSGIEGTIRVSFTINKNGTVSGVSAGDGNTLLKKSALKAINDSTPFHVSDKLSEYMPMQMSVPLEFKLEE
ncbi:MAG: hypothetical protein KN64_05235 [Sulfurovum sp. AS07-7]|nr:MAG: hypothetical protein KN64_05235 [Sulfurovum sp. AS07-7]